MCYGLMEITDWIFYFANETKKISSAKKKWTKNRQYNSLSRPDFCQSVGRDQTNIFLFLAHCIF